MGVVFSLIILGVVCWFTWTTLKNDVKTEHVSRDLEDAMTDEAIARVKRGIETKVEEWRKHE